MSNKLVENLNTKLIEAKKELEKPLVILNTTKVYLKSAKILIINESKDFYMPLFMLGCEQVVYESTPLNCKEDYSKGKVGTQIHLSYYNSDAGFFEPAIDGFGVEIDMDFLGKSS